MEGRNGMTRQAGMRRRRSLRGAALHCLSWAMLSVLLAACSIPSGNSGMAERQTAAAEPADKLAIVVNLAVDEGAGSEANPVAAATARVMKELKTAMPPEDLAAVRTFGALPVLALTADGATIARLLAMPEVASVERDRELAPLGIAPVRPRFK